MRASYDCNPLEEFANIICEEFSRYQENRFSDNFKEFNDSLMKLILENNGCSFIEEAHYSEYDMKYSSKYTIYFLYGARANEANEFYDYMEFYGTKYLIVFMDYFHDMYYPPKVIDDSIDDIMGNSVYFNAIKQITDVFISTTTSAAELMGSLSRTAAANNYRFAGLLIAAYVLEATVGLTEDDVSMIKFDKLKKIMDNYPLSLQLLGVKYKE